MIAWKDEIYQNHIAQPLFSSEIHYFRIKKKDWEHVIESTLEMGNTCIAFYVPWFVHEVKNGVYDFDGETCEETDLVSWLKLLKEKNVDVILRPGPYIYAEMTNLGLPQWLVEEHPEARIMEYRNGTLIPSAYEFAFAHNNPVFLFYVKRWLKKVIEVCRPYIGKDQMISAIQLCNEIPGVDIDDMNPMTLQLQREDSPFFQFYEKKYKSIEKFNKAYQTTYKDFQQIRPWEMVKAKERYRVDHLQYYYEDYYVRYFKSLKAVYEEENITGVTYLHNAYNPRAISLHHEIKKQIPELVFGIDNYFSLRSGFDDHAAAYYCEFAPAYAKAAFHQAPFVLEHESGYWLDIPKIYGKDLYLFTIWSFLGGFKGCNLFLGHEGINKAGMGMLAQTHEWQAPIKVNGEKKATFFELQKAYQKIKADIVLTKGDIYYDMAYSFPFRSGLIWEKISEQSDQLYYYLFQCNLSAEIIDIKHEENPHQTLLYLSDERMSLEVQKKLLKDVKEGKNLILFGRLPEYDENLSSCTYLMDELGIYDYEYHDYDCWGQKLILKNQDEEILQDQYPMVEIHTKKEHQIIATDQKNKTVAIKIAYGKGNCYLYTSAIVYQMKSQKHLMDRICDDIGLKKKYKSENFRIIEKTYRNKTVFYVLNPHPFEMKENILINGENYTITLPAYEYEEIEK